MTLKVGDKLFSFSVMTCTSMTARSRLSIGEKTDMLPVGKAGAADGIWQACAAGEREIEASL
jgi:hypothetical protein